MNSLQILRAWFIFALAIAPISCGTGERSQIPVLSHVDGGPARTGVMPGPAPAGELTELWRVHGDIACPVIVGGDYTLYTCRGKGDSLLALDPDDGTVIWTVPTQEAGGFALGAGLLIGNTEEAGVYFARDAGDGALRWQVYDQCCSYSAPLILANLAIVGWGSRVAAVDLLTGEILWDRTYEKLSRPEFSSDGTALLLASEARIYRVVPETGGVVWAAGDSNRSLWWQRPAISQGLVVTRERWPRGGRVGIVVRDLETGAERWNSGPIGWIGWLVVDESAIYVPVDGVLRAFDLQTGDPRWETRFVTRRRGGASLSDHALYVGVEGGAIDVYDARSGAWLRTASVDPGLEIGDIAIAGGRIYVVGDNERLDEGVLVALGSR